MAKNWRGGGKVGTKKKKPIKPPKGEKKNGDRVGRPRRDTNGGPRGPKKVTQQTG